MSPEIEQQTRTNSEADPLQRQRCSTASQSERDWFAAMLKQGVAPLIAESYVRHRRDLSQLLKTHPGKCAAYRGDERLEIGPKPFPTNAMQIGVYEMARASFEHIPIIGVRAFHKSNLRLFVKFERQSVSLRTKGWPRD
jgi:hypothetical protein